MIEYSKEINVCKSTICGYMIFGDSHHPLAMSNGMVYLHRHLASLKVGHWLTPEEHVHHADGNKSNNDAENLIILTQSEHSIIEQENRGGKRHEDRFCSECGKKIDHGAQSGMCSTCFNKSIRLFDPSKEELQRLVWEIPTTKIAEMFGVSDNSIGHRCKIMGIKKPPRGYWQKINPPKGMDKEYYKQHPEKVRRGEDSPTSILKEQEVMQMLIDFHENGVSAVEIIKKYKIDRSHFYKIMKGEQWNHVYRKFVSRKDGDK